MMDDKYLAEIKARYELGRPAQQREVKALLAEVERLTAENAGLRANSMIQEHIIAGARDPIKDGEIMRLIMDNAAKDQQIDTLKKALELAIRKIGHCGNCDQNCMFCALKDPEYFIHQAQEQEEA